MQKPNHIPVLDHLRGTAALFVCLFHFSHPKNLQITDDPVHNIAQFGYLGVQMFFVISGFVLPYSLYLRSYQLRDAGEFFVRRLRRLEPPYFASILLSIILQLLYSLVPGFRGSRFVASPTQLLAHIAYLNAIFKYPWINDVFWTLAIEFQFYIVIAFAFPLLNGSRLAVRVICVTSIALLGFLGNGNRDLLPLWLPLFAMGIVTFQAYVGHLNTLSFCGLFSLISMISYTVLGLPRTLAGVLTAAAILIFGGRQLPKAFQPIAWAGMISYSLYLVHVPIGGRIINLQSTRMPDLAAYRYPAIALAFLVSIASAYVFWRMIERPSQLWAKNFRAASRFKKGEEN